MTKDDSALSSFVIVYGRRRTVLMIMIGYLVGIALRWVSTSFGQALAEMDAQVVGFIIPGLIAIWLDRQGVVETVAAMVTASIVVRLLLVCLAQSPGGWHEEALLASARRVPACVGTGGLGRHCSHGRGPLVSGRAQAGPLQHQDESGPPGVQGDGCYSATKESCLLYTSDAADE